MKRNLFIAAAASVISALPALGKAEGRAQPAPAETNVEASGWKNPSWCCASAIVWLDIPAGKHYRKGDGRYGRTERGAYTCEKLAVAAGSRLS
jgi:hypothetical protein